MADLGARAARSAGRHALRAVVVLYVGVIVLVPVAMLVWRALEPGIGSVLDTVTSNEAELAFQRSAIIAGCAVVLDAVFGLAVGLLLARYRFPGRRVLDAVIDLPVAVSPIVAGLALTLVYAAGGWLGLPVGAFVPAMPGMVLATVFVSLPLVLRSVLPVLEEAGIEQEQAAASLGAGWFTTFRRITLPTIRTALGYGIVLSLARCIGEYGAVLVIAAGFNSIETAPLLVSNFLENDLQPDPAYAVAFVLMLVSVLAIAITTYLQRRRTATS